MPQPVRMSSDSGKPADPQPGAPAEAIFPEPDVRLDTVGLYCPVPIIKTQARIRSMQPGEVLEIASDDRVILLDMPAWCRSTGHEYLGGRETVDEILLLYVRKVERSSGGPGAGARSGGRR
ncbi:MAG TPA: sulfurtransferase TusA family protein [Candidatus Polarisedimenticolia bacterium]|nr:sulfurtransferase TusA family protein [Candidatus Polarisedimenticolia bacterium]